MGVRVGKERVKIVLVTMFLLAECWEFIKSQLTVEMKKQYKQTLSYFFFIIPYHSRNLVRLAQSSVLIE